MPSQAFSPLSARSFSSKLVFTKDHEYVKLDGNVGVVGITHFAQEQLGDIVFVDLPSEGDEVDAEDSIGAVESVKAASDIYAPVSGKIIAVNDELGDNPALMNSSPMEDGWLVKMELTDLSQVDGLMDQEAYDKFLEAEDH